MHICKQQQLRWDIVLVGSIVNLKVSEIKVNEKWITLHILIGAEIRDTVKIKTNCKNYQKCPLSGTDWFYNAVKSLKD